MTHPKAHDEAHASSAASRPDGVYTVHSRPGGREVWLRIGTAHRNANGSVTIRLEALPLDGELQVYLHALAHPHDSPKDAG